MVYFRWQPSTFLQNFIYLSQSAAELLLFVQKFKMAAAAILVFIFVQYFGIVVCRTFSVTHAPNFVQICAIVLRTGPMKWPQRWVAALVVTLPAGKGMCNSTRVMNDR